MPSQNRRAGAPSGSPIQDSASRHPEGARPAVAPGAQGLDRILLAIVDGGLAGVVLVAPWFMGGRHPLGEFVLVILAIAVAFAWMLRQTISPRATAWKRSSAELLLAAGTGLVLLQLAPLPPSALDSLSPHTAVILPLWTAGAEKGAAEQPLRMGEWTQVTMTPESTRGCLVMFLAYGLLFVVTVQRIRGVEDVEKIFNWLALSAILLAAVGVLQYLASNGKFLWIYQHPFRDTNEAVVGPFINRNHFAHLLALGLGPLLWSIQRAMNRRHDRTPGGFSKGPGSQREQFELILRLLGLGVVLFAGLMSLSRGGAAMMFLSTAICLAAFYRAALLGKKFVMAMVAIFALIGVSLAIHGYQTVTNRLGDYTRGSLSDLDANRARRKIWAADAKAVPDYCALGSGIGSHREVYPMYFAEPSDTEYTHAESGYLQVALEAGLPGLALLLIGIALCAAWCLAGVRRAASARCFVCAVAVAASLTVSVIHSFVDFVWYIPSCMAATVLLAACAFRLAGFARLGAEKEARPAKAASRAAFAVLAAGVAMAGTWMMNNRLCAALAAPHWDHYLTYALSSEGKASKALPSNIVEDLEGILRWTPGDARAHIRLAGAYLRRFDQEQKNSENDMALSQIRDAAIASRFGSRAELDRWLAHAIGDTRRYLDGALWHAWRGLSLCPLQGEGYVCLAELCFLQGAGPAAKPAYVEQALKVRPHDGKVLFAAGNEAALVGDVSQAVFYWKQSFQRGPEEQGQLIDLLAGNHVPVVFVLQNFEPDLAALRLLRAKYSELQMPGELRQVLRYYARAAENEVARVGEGEAAELYLELHGVYRGLNEPDKALDCLHRAAAIQPNDYGVRFALGTSLSEEQQFEEAEKHLNWCLQRRPDDPALKVLMTAAIKGRVDQQSRPAETTRLR